MRIEYLEYLTKMKNGETINSIANKLHITPQGLSLAIITIEKELNCTLLNRTKKGVYLTADALELIEYANDFLSKMERLKNKSNDELSGELILATTIGSIRYLLSDKIAKFAKENPQVEIKFKYYNRLDLSIDDIAVDEIIFTALPCYEDGSSDDFKNQLLENDFEYKFLYSCRPCVECHKDMWHKSTISINDLHDCKIIFSSVSGNTHDSVRFFKNNENVEIIYEDVPEIYYEYLLNKVGYGWSVNSNNKINFYAANQLRQVIVTDNIRVDFGYIEKKNATHSEIIQRFIDFISSN